MNVDKHGVIGQIQPGGWVEGGDSVNWFSLFFFYGGWLNDRRWSPKKITEKFEVRFGAWVRHFDPDCTFFGFGAHYKNPWNGCITRDQLTGILAMLIESKQYAAIFRIFIHHGAWLWLFSYSNIKNGVDPKTFKWKWSDPTGPDIWSMYVRALYRFSLDFYNPPLAVLAWCALWVLDLHNMGNAIVNRFQKDDDVLSFVTKLNVGTRYAITPTSLITWWIADKKGLNEKLKKYWCNWRETPEMYELMKFKEV